MKVVTNKYPIFGTLMVNSDNSVKKESLTVLFEEGKVFKVLGVSFDDFILECEGRAITVRGTVFELAFTETNIEI